MKHWAIIFLLFCAALPWVGLTGLQVAQYRIRMRMEESLEHAALHTITLSPKQVHWVRPKKELLLEGKLFDVHRISIEKNSITVVGLFDEEESKITKALSKEAHNGPACKMLLQLMHCCQLVAEPVCLFDFGLPAIQLKTYCGFNTNLSLKYYSIEGPPPKPLLTLLS